MEKTKAVMEWRVRTVERPKVVVADASPPRGEATRISNGRPSSCEHLSFLPRAQLIGSYSYVRPAVSHMAPLIAALVMRDVGRYLKAEEVLVRVVAIRRAAQARVFMFSSDCDF